VPYISVCIPAYNRASQLGVLLDSIVNQSFQDFEIVIAEDGSPERESIKAIASQYDSECPKKIRYFENETNLGYDGNLRRLIELARGRYVLFMGNDDLLAPHALSAVALATQKNSGVGVVLRSYSSFTTDPQQPKQIFRYFDQDRYFPPGPETMVTFFRRCVFISGMVFKRASALACSTKEFDGTLLYQQHLAGHILAQESGVYLTQILSYHRLGGVPDFGSSAAEQGLFVPKQQTPDSSVHFMRGMLSIAQKLDDQSGSRLANRILHDIGNYSYPILSIQAEQPTSVFLRYLMQLAKLGFWKVPLFYVYSLSLMILGKARCDALIAWIKKRKGRAPMLGRVYAGEIRKAKEKADS
jgi:abequosyltransferase